MFNIYQLMLSGGAYDALVNYGLEEAAEVFPEVAIESDITFFGPSKFRPEYFGYYSKVAEVDANTPEQIDWYIDASVGTIAEMNGAFFMMNPSLRWDRVTVTS